MEAVAKLNARLCELTRQAGAKIMRLYGNHDAVKWKRDASPLTAADRASHDFLVESLRSLMAEATVGFRRAKRINE
jgi:3'(2'), 5'-bisphosphate nucleotidase